MASQCARSFFPTAKIFRQIDLQYMHNSLFSEKVNLTEFLPKIVGENLQISTTLHCGHVT